MNWAPGASTEDFVRINNILDEVKADPTNLFNVECDHPNTACGGNAVCVTNALTTWAGNGNDLGTQDGEMDLGFRSMMVGDGTQFTNADREGVIYANGGGEGCAR